MPLLSRSSEGGYIPNQFMAGPPKGMSVTTSETAGEVTSVDFSNPIYSIIIENQSETETLYVSFDGGSTWVELLPGTLFRDEPFITNTSPTIQFKSTGASQPVRIVYRAVLGV